jgi:hypothetical protein
MNKYLMLTAAALFGAAAPVTAQGADFAGGTYIIHFNGFCDGMKFRRMENTPIVLGEHLNVDCAGGENPVAGTTKNKEYLLFENSSSNYSSFVLAYGIHKPIVEGGTYDLWACFSGTTCFNSGGGTYGLGCCDARGSGTPVTAKVAELIAQRRASRR